MGRKGARDDRHPRPQEHRAGMRGGGHANDTVHPRARYRLVPCRPRSIAAVNRDRDCRRILCPHAFHFGGPTLDASPGFAEPSRADNVPGAVQLAPFRHDHNDRRHHCRRRSHPAATRVMDRGENDSQGSKTAISSSSRRFTSVAALGAFCLRAPRLVTPWDRLGARIPKWQGSDPGRTLMRVSGSRPVPRPPVPAR